jgi:antirestriction protein ArdC
MQSQTELRQTITNTIIDALKDGGLPPWKRPWADDNNAPGLHTSMSTGSPYRGINHILLQCSSMRQGFKSKWWGTYNQITFNGASVQKGQKATKIVLWKPIQRKRSNEQGKEVEDNFLVMRAFCVFNAEQTNGLEKFRVGFSKSEVAESDRFRNAQELIDSIGADVRHGGNEAYFRPQDDFIQLPFPHQFQSEAEYFQTCFHEHCHWAEKRVGFDRDQISNAYAFFELVADIGACQVMAGLNLPSNSHNTASYVSHWLKGMTDDPKFIFRAASFANKAADYLLSFSRTRAELTEAIDELIMA